MLAALSVVNLSVLQKTSDMEVALKDNCKNYFSKNFISMAAVLFSHKLMSLAADAVKFNFGNLNFDSILRSEVLFQLSRMIEFYKLPT